MYAAGSGSLAVLGRIGDNSDQTKREAMRGLVLSVAPVFLPASAHDAGTGLLFSIPSREAVETPAMAREPYSDAATASQLTTIQPGGCGFQEHRERSGVRRADARVRTGHEQTRRFFFRKPWRIREFSIRNGVVSTKLQ